MSDWLKNLSAGDEVAVFEGYGRQSARIAKVARTTAHFIFVGHGKFRRKDGREPGSSWNRAVIREPVQVYRDEWDNERLREKIRKAIDSKETPLETIKLLAAVLEPQP